MSERERFIRKVTLKETTAFVRAAYIVNMSVASTLDLMSQRTGGDWFSWVDQEKIIRDLINIQDHDARLKELRYSMAAAQAGVADGTVVHCTTEDCRRTRALCKACAENEGICICP